jgi:uncharacterized protein YjbI with pentapeptide repeats
MADAEPLRILKEEGVDAWNAWRRQVPETRIDLEVRIDLSNTDLSWADLSNAYLYRADLSGANLHRANLSRADLRGAILCRADLHEANLHRADLRTAILNEASLYGANLSWANLSWANLPETNLNGANLSGADFSRANLSDARLRQANLSSATLVEAHLNGADLSGTRLFKANLSGADLLWANLYRADLSGANLTGCAIHGVSAWELTVSKSTKQQNLVITLGEEPQITADDIEVAQFIYLLLHNEKIQKVIDTITSKVVLILGRFSLRERKTVLDALRGELRKPGRNYVPVVFDFEKPRSQTTINTIMLLARMARFVIADISDAKSVLQELQAIVPHSPKLPVQPIIIAAQAEPGMFDSFEAYPWVLKVHRYDTPAQLLVHLDERVIGPAEAKVLELQGPKPTAS